ncbi:molybdopterin-dependent oxidoreductase [Paracoccus tegillarcae]|uniref:Oxidoreductase n=1 Tax=Paracoccus tegillarcae TaxID=1529068 RepID=A0A2K9EY86_9RHOB|nr:molybdopterin-dependent oxidoreductase [Paracoccus tegillarcae]AUH33062.1 oxidoreductase [Paracoccus tegillarcae]
MSRRLFGALAVIAMTGATGLPAIASDLAAPTGEVMLTVSGNVETTNVDGTAQLDLDMLEAMDTTTIETSTIWTEGMQTFEGVSLAALVEALGITGETLRATAINDYEIEIPMTDAVEGGPIVAYRQNGDTMSLRDKGPLWIIYPYDADADYRTEVIYSRSIWQMDRIEAVD